jgi:hypothetical protein
MSCYMYYIASFCNFINSPARVVPVRFIRYPNTILSSSICPCKCFIRHANFHKIDTYCVSKSDAMKTSLLRRPPELSLDRDPVQARDARP